MSIKGFVWKQYYSLISHGNITIGNNFSRRKSVDIHVTDGGSIRIGDNVFFNKYCTIAAKDYIEIGSDTIFGESVRIYDSNHRFSDPKQKIINQGFTKKGISIGSDCWIGSNTVILKGVTIGNHVIIGSGCVIDFNVPDWTIIKSKASAYEQIERHHEK